MLFFKSKHKGEEILPPPPPLELELEEEPRERPKFFDEIAEPKKAETIPEEGEFESLLKEVEELKQKKAVKKKKIKAKKITKKPVIKKEAKIKKIPVKKLEIKLSAKPVRKKIGDFLRPEIPKKFLWKEKKITLKKPAKQLKKPVKKPLPKTRAKAPVIKIAPIRAVKEKPFKNGRILPIEKIKFELPKELEEPAEEIELPETLEGFEIEDLGKKFGIEKEVSIKKEDVKAKPKEILEAEEEIKSAIENIKKKEKPSILKRLFSKKPKEEVEEHLMPELPAADDISRIQNKINEARQALMKFDLETARKVYIEAMMLYNRISQEDKAKVYQDIKELYFERKSAEELKV